MGNNFLGIDIGGTKTTVSVGRPDHVLSFETFPTRIFKTPEDALLFILKTGKNLMGKCHIQNIAAIGISCGGPLDSSTGHILSPPHLPGWNNVAIKDFFEQKLSTPCYLENDANACALAEWKYGAGKGANSLIYCTMGTGFGAGIIVNGQLWRGANGMAGEIGHVRLDVDGMEIYGKRGSAESFVSGEGILQQARILAQKMGILDPVDVKWLFDLAHEGNPEAIALVNQIAHRLGQTIAILLDILNPEIVVIGSIFLRQESLLRPEMERVLSKEVLANNLLACRIVVPSLGEDIGTVASLCVAEMGAKQDSPDSFKKMVPVARKFFEVARENNEEQIKNRKLSIIKHQPKEVDLEGIWESIQHAFELITESLDKGGTLFICGNGGSHADAQHIMGELVKGFRLKRALRNTKDLDETSQKVLANLQGGLAVITLGTCTALTTAIINDLNAELLFAQELCAQARAHDVVLGVSTSGLSKNIQYVLSFSSTFGLKTILLTGAWPLLTLPQVDCVIRAPYTDTVQIQDAHRRIYHCLCEMIEKYYFGDF